MSGHVDAVLSLGEPSSLAVRAARVAVCLSDPGQHQHGDDRMPRASEHCWYCEARRATERSDLCLPCRKFLAGVSDVDPRRPFDPALLRAEIEQANAAIRLDVAVRRAAALVTH